MTILNPVPLFGPLDPYNYVIDNLPIQALITRTDLINAVADSTVSEIVNARGNTPSLNDRLSASLGLDGSLLTSSVDSTNHNIGYHEDGMGPDLVDYVRMTLTEREKLAMVSDGATSLSIEFQTPTASNIIVFDNGPIIFESSPSCDWAVYPPNRIQANLHYPLESAHRHYYDVVPTSPTLTPNYQNYLTGISQPFMFGSLRVYINGVRLSESANILVTVSNQLNSYTANTDGLGFILQNPITSVDVIRIDFDISLAGMPVPPYPPV